MGFLVWNAKENRVDTLSNAVHTRILKRPQAVENRFDGSQPQEPAYDTFFLLSEEIKIFFSP